MGRANSNYSSDESILNSPLCPKEGQRDIYFPAAFVRKVRVERKVKDEPNEWWIITVESATVEVSDDVHPLSRPAVINRESLQESGFTSQNNKGETIFNTAGDIMLFPRRKSSWVYRITKNFKRVPQWLYDYENAVNRGSVTIKGQRFKKKTLMAYAIRSTEQEEEWRDETVRFEQLNMMIAHKKEGWQVKEPNVGFNQLIEDEFVKRDRTTGHILRNSDGTPVKEKRKIKVPIVVGEDREIPRDAQPLDKKGRWIERPKPRDIHYIEEDVQDELDFNRLPIR